jgi:serine/threonine-protein kinase RsbW
VTEERTASAIRSADGTLAAAGVGAAGGSRAAAAGQSAAPAGAAGPAAESRATESPAGVASPAATAAAASDAGEHAAQDRVTIRMPAEGAYLSVLRTATAGLAARLDFTLDEIEDLRIAVDEACAMLLGQAVPGASLECAFTLGRDMMTISVSVPCLEPRPPASDTFAWTVLTALAGSVDARVGPGDLLTIVMRKTRPSSGPV